MKERIRSPASADPMPVCSAMASAARASCGPASQIAAAASRKMRMFAGSDS
jgi:hypothetical protein